SHQHRASFASLINSTIAIVSQPRSRELAARLNLTDDQQSAVYRATQPLEPPDRAAFLRTLAERLANIDDPGDGQVFLLIRELQKSFFVPPLATDGDDSSEPRLHQGLPKRLRRVRRS